MDMRVGESGAAITDRWCASRQQLNLYRVPFHPDVCTTSSYHVSIFFPKNFMSSRPTKLKVIKRHGRLQYHAQR